MHSTPSSRAKSRRSAAPANPASSDERDLTSRVAERIHFPEDSAWVRDTPLANAFKQALCDTLRSEDVERLKVRCGVTRDESNGLKFMCKVDYAACVDGVGPESYAWSWWSPLVETPQELIAELKRALKQRGERLSGARRTARPEAKADKARGPAHGTWSTELWDLGRSDQGETFCRNRRSRWPGHSAASRPFRPRYPR